MSELHDKAEAGGRNWYFEGSHDAEEPEDIAARLALVAERDALLAENERLTNLCRNETMRVIIEIERAEAAEARLLKLCEQQPEAWIVYDADGKRRRFDEESEALEYASLNGDRPVHCLTRRPVMP